MSKLKNATIAAVFAFGASVAMVTPASAVGTATAYYNCTPYGNPVKVTFTRTTTPPAKNLSVKADLSFTVPAVTGPIGVGGISAQLTGPPTPPYPITVTNPNVIPPGTYTSITLTGTAPATLTGPPATIPININPPNITVMCTLLSSPAPAGWSI